MNLNDLFEARRNPEINNRYRKGTNVDEILKWAKPHYYASFTKLPKIGINPMSEYSTPLGIYAYPLSSETIIHQIRNDGLPFAGNAKYVNIINAHQAIIDVSWWDKFLKAVDYETE